MKYDLTRKLRNLDDSFSNDTAGTGFRHALLAEVNPAGQPVGTDVKRKRYQLFVKLANATEVDLTIDEVSLLKDAVWVFPTLTAGQLDDILEQK